MCYHCSLGTFQSYMSWPDWMADDTTNQDYRQEAFIGRELTYTLKHKEFVYFLERDAEKRD